MSCLKWMLVLTVSLASFAARAQGNHVDEATVEAAKAEFRSTYNKSGMSGVSENIRACYLKNGLNKKLMLKCILEDIAAIRLDAGMRKLFIAQGFNGPPVSPFLADKAIAMREEIYWVPMFGSVRSMLSYYGETVDTLPVDKQ